ncbi:MAG TPA: phage protein GemA/Gp16 family protein [Desulfuromonadaceae bacterium]
MKYYGKRRAEATITKGQITTIKMAQAQLCIADEDYREMLYERYRVRSCTNLTFNQAGHFITELQKKGFRLLAKEPKAAQPRHPRRTAPELRPGEISIAPRQDTAKVAFMVRPEELDKVNAIARLITWRAENGLALFLEKRMGIKEGRIKTSSQFRKAIEGLKAMYENQMKAAHGPDWWTKRFEDPEVVRYIAEHCPKEYRE